MKTKVNSLVALAAFLGLMLFSCGKDTPAPTAEIFATTDGYTVTFNPSVTDVSSYSWDFGDGETSTEAKPVHVYDQSGTYTVTLVVKGDGGEATATKQIEIAASLEEMLTGGPAATSGKTWVMSTDYNASEDGGGPVMNEMPVMLPSAENVLTLYGLGAEYDNEYTFFHNGSYSVNVKNGNALAGAVYGAVTQTMVGDPSYDIGMCAATYTAPASASWTLNTADFTVDAITDPNTTDVPPAHDNVTFTGKNWIQLSEGAYFGILDLPSSPKFIIKEITASRMKVALFLCGYGYGEDPAMMALPTNMIHISFVPKSSK
ncbi:MAG: PKD domain-containing protein [Bacteroidales bacterium]